MSAPSGAGSPAWGPAHDPGDETPGAQPASAAHATPGSGEMADGRDPYYWARDAGLYIEQDQLCQLLDQDDGQTLVIDVRDDDSKQRP